MTATNADRSKDHPVWLERFDGEGHRQYTIMWRFPSGGLGEASIQRCADRRQRVTFTWDSPPIEGEDLDSLIEVVIPEVLSRAEQTLAPLGTTALPIAGGSISCRSRTPVAF